VALLPANQTLKGRKSHDQRHVQPDPPRCPCRGVRGLGRNLKSLDAGGVSPTTGLGLFDHFADDAEVFFPKWGVARGKEEVIQMFTDVGGTLKGIKHNYDGFIWYMNGTDSFAVEGTSEGEHRDGPWVADQPKWGAGRFCDCFTVSGGKITRLFIYLDPDYAGKDTARYGWIPA
jgi:SnoaL-like domain